LAFLALSTSCLIEIGLIAESINGDVEIIFCLFLPYYVEAQFLITGLIAEEYITQHVPSQTSKAAD
jgi:hypothetical protein